MLWRNGCSRCRRSPAAWLPWSELDCPATDTYRVWPLGGGRAMNPELRHRGRGCLSGRAQRAAAGEGGREVRRPPRRPGRPRTARGQPVPGRHTGVLRGDGTGPVPRTGPRVAGGDAVPAALQGRGDHARPGAGRAVRADARVHESGRRTSLRPLQQVPRAARGLRGGGRPRPGALRVPAGRRGDRSASAPRSPGYSSRRRSCEPPAPAARAPRQGRRAGAAGPSARGGPARNPTAYSQNNGNAMVESA